MTILLGFQGQSFHEMKFLFSGTQFHALPKTAMEHSSKQGKGSTFCTLLVGWHGPQAPFTSANAVVVLRISGIRHRDGRRVHRSGDLLVWRVGDYLVHCPVPEFRSYTGYASGL